VGKKSRYKKSRGGGRGMRGGVVQRGRGKFGEEKTKKGGRG